jgi:hypothetical protein
MLLDITTISGLFDSKPHFLSETNNVALGSHTNKQFLKSTVIKHMDGDGL